MCKMLIFRGVSQLPNDLPVISTEKNGLGHLRIRIRIAKGARDAEDFERMEMRGGWPVSLQGKNLNWDPLFFGRGNETWCNYLWQIFEEFSRKITGSCIVWVGNFHETPAKMGEHFPSFLLFRSFCWENLWFLFAKGLRVHAKHQFEALKDWIVPSLVISFFAWLLGFQQTYEKCLFFGSTSGCSFFHFQLWLNLHGPQGFHRSRDGFFEHRLGSEVKLHGLRTAVWRPGWGLGCMGEETRKLPGRCGSCTVFWDDF